MPKKPTPDPVLRAMPRRTALVAYLLTSSRPGTDARIAACDPSSDGQACLARHNEGRPAFLRLDRATRVLFGEIPLTAIPADDEETLPANPPGYRALGLGLMPPDHETHPQRATQADLDRLSGPSSAVLVRTTAGGRNLLVVPLAMDDDGLELAIASRYDAPVRISQVTSGVMTCEAQLVGIRFPILLEG